MATSTASKLLLKGGTVLLHDEHDHVTGQRLDIAVEDGIIVQIEEDIAVSKDTKVLDCKDKIVSPGFVDTRMSPVMYRMPLIAPT